eukprot:g24318.t1
MTANPEDDEEFKQFLKDAEKLRIEQEKENEKEKKELAKRKAEKKDADEGEEEAPPAKIEVEPGGEVETLLVESLTATVARQNKKAVEDRQFEDCALVYLRVRNYDIKSAAERLNRYMSWRVENKAADWTPSAIEMCKKVLTFGCEHPEKEGCINILPGLSKDGCVVVWIREMYNNPKALGAENLVRTMHFVLFNELLTRGAKTQAAGVCFVPDLKGASHKNMDNQLPKLFFKNIRKVWPIRVKLIHIQNPIPLVTTMVPIVKAFMSEKLQERFHVSKSPGDIFKYIDKENVPEELGGALKYDRGAWLASIGCK